MLIGNFLYLALVLFWFQCGNAISESHSELKDCLPYLFRSFRNNIFKISLGNMLYFQNKLYKF